ncbi:hypothetical protein HMPREF3221_02325 [Fusobacterium nucleatum]|uniref:Uncharacterized protein n=1 Tax=Fusobacterium nucleatum TaxID=851 RepID=A0A133NCU7_FUSNU|nr:hypothetical protein HMPREF3221_02325 [Fusobacterium nucleatum]
MGLVILGHLYLCRYYYGKLPSFFKEGFFSFWGERKKFYYL